MIERWSGCLGMPAIVDAAFGGFSNSEVAWYRDRPVLQADAVRRAEGTQDQRSAPHHSICASLLETIEECRHDTLSPSHPGFGVSAKRVATLVLDTAGCCDCDHRKCDCGLGLDVERPR